MDNTVEEEILLIVFQHKRQLVEYIRIPIVQLREVKPLLLQEVQDQLQEAQVLEAHRQEDLAVLQLQVEVLAVTEVEVINKYN